MSFYTSQLQEHEEHSTSTLAKDSTFIKTGILYVILGATAMRAHKTFS